MGSVVLDQPPHRFRDFVQGLLRRDAAETSIGHTLEGVAEALGAVGLMGCLAPLPARIASADRIVRIAADRDDASVLDACPEGAISGT